MVDRIITGFLNTNTYLFSHWKKGCIVIDPAGNVDEIINHIEMKNFRPLAIICTHGHFDHIAGISQLKAHYESEGLKIPIYIHSADSGYLGKEGRERHLRDINTLGAEYHSLFHSFLENLPDYDFLLEENDRILDTDLTVLHTPGHTPGSISIYSESDFILFSGDTLFFEGIGRTDLPGGNMEQLLTSIREKLYVLPEDTRVFPGHGPYTSIEREKSHNPFV
jgi:glyoxylase-like metal-dependent hydrolase (beta-lactamase superfamily II)